MDGGYDDGYRKCRCFWGHRPGSLVAKLLTDHDVAGQRALDLGCGEGKNAAALARAGAVVTAVDCSELAICNGKAAFSDLNISWAVGHAADFLEDSADYDIVVMYGLAHCLESPTAIRALLRLAISGTACGGIHVLAAFNDGSQDLQRAHPGFKPTLIPHAAYLAAYAEYELVYATDAVLTETHPHNNVQHHHSLTRMLVRIR